MYAAMANRENEEGTTRLHLDVTDAANLMVWAADPSRPAARWHIFRQGDADALREAIWASKWCAEADHPIHSQTVYLKAEMLQHLADKYNIRPWIIEQSVGDLVVIPAGAAHQVCDGHI